MSAVHSCSGMVAIGHVLMDMIGKTNEFPEILAFEDSRPLHIDSQLMRSIIQALEKGSGYESAALSRTLGGSAAVTAMTTSNLGLQTYFLGCIGRDTEGERLKHFMYDAGTRFSAFFSDKDTGMFLSLTDTQRKHALRVSPSAARDVRKLEIADSELPKDWILYLDGLLIDSGPWLCDIASRARRNGMTIAMDFSTPGNARAHARELRQFADTYCDLVFANAIEADAVYGNSGKSDMKTTLTLVEKRGAEGAILYRNREQIHLSAGSVEVLDTTCAGDALAAGFIKAMSEGRDDEECLAAGVAAAAIAIQYVGSGYDRSVMRAGVDGTLASVSGKSNK